MQKRWSFFFLLLAVWQVGKAQIPANPLGLNPNSLRWHQIKTDKVQVIFPAGMEQYGQRTANLVHYLWDAHNESIGDKRQRITMILQNQTTVPNGMVTVGPFRSECYTTPPQFNTNGAGNWFDLLILHEYRHVKQFANTKRGITNLARKTFGSWTWGGFLGLTLPRWYLEGDATVTETALSNAGRGRLPAFEMEYKALALEGVHYTYDKAYADSYRDFVPSFYNLGYYMTGYARRNFGNDIWNKVVADAVQFKGVFYPFARNMQKHMGLRPRKLYARTFNELDSNWVAQARAEALEVPANRKNLPAEYAQPFGDGVCLTKDKDCYTNFRLPRYLNDSTLVVEKSGFKEIRTFYKVHLAYPAEEAGKTGYRIPRKVEKMFSPGINVGDNTTLSVNKNAMVWSELTYHERWGGKDYSVVRLKWEREANPRKISHRSRYFSPALSPNNQQIIAAEVPDTLRYSLVLLSSAGELLKRYENPQNYFLAFPVFSPNGQKIVGVAQQGEQNWLFELDLASGNMRELTTRTHWQLSYPTVTDKYVLFSAAYTGTNNIFAIQYDQNAPAEAQALPLEADKGLFQVSFHGLGAFAPAVSPDGKRLAYSGFSRMGHDIYEIPLDTAQWKPYLPAKENNLRFFQPLMKMEGGESVLSKVPQNKFEVRRFRKLSSLFNVHSLLPYAYPPEIGARILADNKFSTFSGELETYYNLNERTWRHGAQITFAQFYPIFRAGYLQGDRVRSMLNFKTESDTSFIATFFSERWQERDFYAGVRLPFNLTQGSAFNNVSFSADYHYLQLQSYNRFFDKAYATRYRVQASGAQRDNPRFFQPRLENQNLHTVDFRLRASSQAPRAHRQFLPRWGAFSELRYLSTVGKGDLRGSMFVARLDLYVPGLLRTHSLSFNLAYQYERYTNNYKFRNQFFYPRGYAVSPFSDGLAKFGANYALPLCYPDIKLGSLVLLKRIKSNLFFDSASAQVSSYSPPFREQTGYMRSFGGELTFDVRALRLVELEFGVRYSYLIDANYLGESSPHAIEFLFLGVGI